MKKVTKRTIACILTLVFVLGLAGCGNGNGGAKSNGKTLSIVAQTNGLGQDWLMNAAKAYENKTGTKVEVEFDAYLSSNLTTTLESSATEVADLYYAATYEWAVWSYKDDLVVDLTDFMNEKGEDGKSLNERTNCYYRYVTTEDGTQKQTIVPLENAPSGLVYNKKMMKYICQDILGWEKEHEYPVNTKELQEVIDAVAKVQKDGSNKELFTYSQNGQTLDVETFVWSGSVGMLEFLTKSWIAQYLGEEGLTEFYSQYESCDMLNHEAFYVAYQKMIDLLQLTEDSDGEYYSETSVPNCVSFNHTASQSQFLMNKALMCPTGSWFYSEMKETITDLDNIGFMPVPYLSDDAGNPITGEGVEMPKDADGNYLSVCMAGTPDYFIIPQRSEKQDEAKEFLRFIFSTEYMPNLANDLQAPLAIDFDDSKCDKNAWYKEVDDAMERIHMADVWTGTKMQAYSKIGLYYNPATPPFSQLSMSSFGSSTKLLDSATGKMITDVSQASGTAVTENVYNYVNGNYKAAKDDWANAIKIVGGK